MTGPHPVHFAIASIVFDSPAVGAYVRQHSPEQRAVGIQRMITTGEHHQRRRLTRDKFLRCTYTALRIDALPTPTRCARPGCTATWPG